MSYPRVQFVSAPSPDAAVRFDCNAVGEWSDDDRWPEHDGFSLGFPSLGGDPEAIGVEYGTRSIEFNLIVRATPDAAFNAFSRLSREVQRPRNWLMVQFTAFSLPVWFYTYRTEQQALNFENVSGVGDTKKNVWGIGVRLAADPFAQGEQQTLGPFTVGNKSTATNPWHVALPDIAGDAPAPVRMRVQTSTDWSGFRPMVSSIALDGGTYDGAPIQVTFRNATPGTGVGAWTPDSGYPGGGYLPVTFSDTAAMAARVSDFATNLPMGTYRMLVWAQRVTTNATFRFRTSRIDGTGIVTDPVDFDRAATPTIGFSSWVDLGVATFPAFASMDDETAQNGQAGTITLEAQRVSGTNNLNLSMLLFVPVETPLSVESRTYFAEFGATGLSPTDRTAEWDEDGNYSLLVTSALPGRSRVSAIPPKPTGGLPVVVPGCTNTLTLLQQTNAHTPADPADDNRDATSVAATVTVTISYAPRYLNLAGSELL